jgi:N-acetylneuraminate synthase
MNYFNLDNKKFSSDNILVIAEACDNHFGSIDKAKKMIELAKEAGADVIKFQHHLPDEEMLPDVPKSDNFNESLYDFLKKNALKLNDHKILKDYCQNVGITYLCTPFSYQAAKELMNLNVCGFKIGSGELSDHPTIKKISEFKKPMLLSTGMSTEDEIKETYSILLNKNIEFGFMNCLSEYPPAYEDLNLKYILKMKKIFDKAVIGHSDHTNDIFSSIAAVTLGAIIIEKHITLDKSFKGPDSDVSIDFNDLTKLVYQIRLIEKSLGNERKINNKEKIIRSWAHRSIVTIKKIKKGEIFSEENIWTKRPGTGIPAKEYENVLGKTSNKDVKNNTLLNIDDIQK